MITGAGGYIGGRLVRTLADNGWQVHGIVREPAPSLSVEQTVCDLVEADDDVLSAALGGAHTVVHLAGETEVVAAREPVDALARTVGATERVSRACAANAVRRVIYLSTIHVYGERIADGVTVTEDMRPEPRSPYAISRLASEHIAASHAAGSYQLVTFRLTNSVGAPEGPNIDRWSLVANDLCRQGAVSDRLELRSSGMQWRDFVPLQSACEAIAAACRPESLPPATYNLGSGRPTTVRALAELIQDEFEHQTGRRPELVAPAPEPDPPGPYHVSIERAARHGVRAEGRLTEAVSEAVRFCLEHREELR